MIYFIKELAQIHVYYPTLTRLDMGSRLGNGLMGTAPGPKTIATLRKARVV